MAGIMAEAWMLGGHGIVQEGDVGRNKCGQASPRDPEPRAQHEVQTQSPQLDNLHQLGGG